MFLEVETGDFWCLLKLRFERVGCSRLGNGQLGCPFWELAVGYNPFLAILTS